MEHSQSFKQTLENMIGLLEAENRHLKALNLDELPKIAEEKIRYASAIDEFLLTADNDASPFAAQARRIKALSAENQKLLSAVKSGVTSAKVRIQNLMSGAQSVGTYTATGGKLNAHDGSVTKQSLA